MNPITINTPEGVIGDLDARLAAISKANGCETDCGVTRFRGRISVNDADVPCVSIIEGSDTVLGTPGRSSMWKIEQRYALVAYVPCDPANPNDAAHAALRDLKRAIFKTNGKPDATLGGKVVQVHYKGRNIAPRADGQPIVMAICEIAVEYVESMQ